MQTLTNRLAQIVAATVLVISNAYASAELAPTVNICRAGIADGTWPVWLALGAILLLSMYAKVTLAED